MTEVDDEFTGQVIEELTARKGEIVNMGPATTGRNLRLSGISRPNPKP